MPLVAAVPETDWTYYERPYVGQPFRRVQNGSQGLYEEGAVRGIKVRGRFTRDDGVVVDGWIAIIRTDLDGSEHRFSYDTRLMKGAETWRPIPDEEMELRWGPGYKLLVERLKDLEAQREEDARNLEVILEGVLTRLAALEERPTVTIASLCDSVPADATPNPPVPAEPPPAARRNRTSPKGG